MIHTTSDRPRTKRRRRTIGCLSLYAVAAAGLFFLVFSPGPTFESDGLDLDFVEQAVSVNAQTAHERLASNLESVLDSHQDFRGANVMGFDKYNAFMSQYQMEAKAENNVALGRYARLPNQNRIHDFYIMAPEQDWFSEYMQDGKRLPFNTDFFVHLEQLDDGKTRIEVIEFFPRVHPGQSLKLCTRHGGPMYTRDVRPVAPTTRDRREMLDLVVRVVELTLPKTVPPVQSD